MSSMQVQCEHASAASHRLRSVKRAHSLARDTSCSEHARHRTWQRQGTSIGILLVLAVGAGARPTLQPAWAAVPMLRFENNGFETARLLAVDYAIEAALGQRPSVPHDPLQPVCLVDRGGKSKRRFVPTARACSLQDLHTVGGTKPKRVGSLHDLHDLRVEIKRTNQEVLPSQNDLIDLCRRAHGRRDEQTLCEDPTLEDFNSKLPLSEAAYSDADSMQSEMQIQQALLQQVTASLEETRRESAQLQHANEALKKQVAVLQSSEQKKKEMLTHCEQQLSLAEKELSWEKRLLQEQMDKNSQLESAIAAHAKPVGKEFLPPLQVSHSQVGTHVQYLNTPGSEVSDSDRSPGLQSPARWRSPSPKTVQNMGERKSSHRQTVFEVESVE